MNPAPTVQALYAAHFDHVWHTLRRLGVPARELEDAAHDVFVVVHRRHGELDPSRPARPWLTGIAWRVASDTRRRAHLRREWLDADAGDGCADGTPAADEALAAHEARALVDAALGALDLDRRVVFVMHELDGESGPAIADALEIPLNTVYSRLRTARERFRAAVRRLALTRGAA
ncbi:MAG: sigma-70 family RNA polymerase sigma factor [bacterium]|nr:sigma-70 family RNA polymerase sigma factor [Myxococcales bacterium]